MSKLSREFFLIATPSTTPERRQLVAFHKEEIQYSPQSNITGLMHSERCRLPSQGLVTRSQSKLPDVLTDSGASRGMFNDSRFFDPATLYNHSAILHGSDRIAPEQEYTFGTVHFVLQGDRGDDVSITLENQLYAPNSAFNFVAPADLHAYGLATVLSPDTAQSGLWCDLDKPTARKFATFIEQEQHSGCPYLRTSEIGFSISMAQRLAWLLDLTIPYVSVVSCGVGCGILGGLWFSRC